MGRGNVLVTALFLQWLSIPHSEVEAFQWRSPSLDSRICGLWSDYLGSKVIAHGDKPSNFLESKPLSRLVLQPLRSQGHSLVARWALDAPRLPARDAVDEPQAMKRGAHEDTCRVHSFIRITTLGPPSLSLHISHDPTSASATTTLSIAEALWQGTNSHWLLSIITVAGLCSLKPFTDWIYPPEFRGN